MSGLAHRAQLDVLMSDIIPLYKAFVERLHQSGEMTLEDFEALCDETRVEYLHYSGSSITTPFLNRVEENLFQLASAYLYFPKEALQPHVPLFSLMLLFFLYGTQPLQDNASMKPLAIPISLSAFESIFRFPLASTLNAPLTLLERVAVSLYAQDGFAIQPEINNRVHIAAVLHAHNVGRCGFLSDMNEKQTLRSTSSTPLGASIGFVRDNQLAARLSEYVSKRSA